MKYIKNLVSVVIPTYKRADLVKRAIESVLNQTYNDIECILVSDNEPGDEFSIKLKEIILPFYSNEKFRFVQQTNHKNGAAARNLGVKNAKGEYIAFLDDDDWWELNKIETQIDFIGIQNKNCAVVSSLVKFYKGDSVIRKSLPYTDGNIYFDILSRQTDVTTCSVLIKHEAFDEIGGFDESLSRHQEVQLLSFLTYKYELKLCPEYLTNVNYDTVENKPKLDSIIKIKSDFYKSVEFILNSMPAKDRKTVIKLNNFEIAYKAFSEKKFLDFLKYSFPVVIYPKYLYLIIKRILRRKKEESISGR